MNLPKLKHFWKHQGLEQKTAAAAAVFQLWNLFDTQAIKPFNTAEITAVSLVHFLKFEKSKTESK